MSEHERIPSMTEMIAVTCDCDHCKTVFPARRMVDGTVYGAERLGVTRPWARKPTYRVKAGSFKP